ncbi:phage portal protein [Lacticaseibacillus paracasei]|uniref:phage portal protein n=1 Tax=Lacticaseibacillus paracasei TaxID=1597 RepID=UPI0034E8AD28
MMDPFEESNLLYQEDITNLTPDRIMKFIFHHHEYQLPRLKKLDRYYKGQNEDILTPDSRRIETGKADYRAVHSFGKYIADFQTAYSVGNPVNVKLDKADERFDQITQVNDLDALNYDLFLDMTRYGRAYEYVYYGSDSIEHCVRLDPLDTFVICSLDVDPQPIMAVRYHSVELVDENNKTIINIIPETWTATDHDVYKPTTVGGAMYLDHSEIIRAFPVVEYDNNRFRTGDFEHVISLIDLYDSAQSDTANYMTDLNDALLVISGDIDALFNGSSILSGVDPNDPEAMKKLAQDKLEIAKEQKSANMLLLKSRITPNGQQTNVDAKFINKEYDVSGTEAYKKRVAEDIHKFSHTPDLTDSNFASNVSGVAMKYKLLGTVELAAIKRRMFEKSLYRRYSIIYALDQSVSGGMKTDPNTIQFTFRDNLPTDDITRITDLVAAGATLPQEYLYRFAPGITDPREITDMIAKQRADSEYSEDLTNNDKDTEGTDQSVRGQTGQAAPPDSK